jgi:hypothetical protein
MIVSKQGPLKLSLKKRPAHLVGHFNGRAEKHGEDDSAFACDIALKDLLLNEEETDVLLGDGTWNRLFKKTRNSGMDGFPEPADFIANSKTPFVLEQRFEESRVTLFMGLDNEDKVEFAVCTVAKIKYEPQSGGLVLVSMQVQCNPDPEQIGNLSKHIDKDIDASVRFGRLAGGKDENQDELPLDANAESKARETAEAA